MQGRFNYNRYCCGETLIENWFILRKLPEALLPVKLLKRRYTDCRARVSLVG